MLNYAVARIVEEMPSGVGVPDVAHNVWNVRNLNKIDSYPAATSSITLNAKQITLGPGAYEVTGSAPGKEVDLHRIQFFNVSDNQAAIDGTTEWSVEGENTVTRSFLKGIVVVTGASKVFELRHMHGNAQNSTNGYGLGFPAPARPEIYAEMFIRKIQ